VSAACPATSCPSTASYPPSKFAARAGLGNGSNVIDLWCTDRPCTGENGSAFAMGKNGMVQGQLSSFGDWMYTQEAIRIIGEHSRGPSYVIKCQYLSKHARKQL
jgi:hypothetical protein